MKWLRRHSDGAINLNPNLHPRNRNRRSKLNSNLNSRSRKVSRKPKLKLNSNLNSKSRKISRKPKLKLNSNLNSRSRKVSRKSKLKLNSNLNSRSRKVSRKPKLKLNSNLNSKSRKVSRKPKLKLNSNLNSRSRKLNRKPKFRLNNNLNNKRLVRSVKIVQTVKNVRKLAGVIIVDKRLAGKKLALNVPTVPISKTHVKSAVTVNRKIAANVNVKTATAKILVNADAINADLQTLRKRLKLKRLNRATRLARRVQLAKNVLHRNPFTKPKSHVPRTSKSEKVSPSKI